MVPGSAAAATGNLEKEILGPYSRTTKIMLKDLTNARKNKKQNPNFSQLVDAGIKANLYKPTFLISALKTL